MVSLTAGLQNRDEAYDPEELEVALEAVRTNWLRKIVLDSRGVPEPCPSDASPYHRWGSRPSRWR